MKIFGIKAEKIGTGGRVGPSHCSRPAVITGPGRGFYLNDTVYVSSSSENTKKLWCVISKNTGRVYASKDFSNRRAHVYLLGFVSLHDKPGYVADFGVTEKNYFREKFFEFIQENGGLL